MVAFPLESSHCFSQSLALCKTAKPSFWGLGACSNSFFPPFHSKGTKGCFCSWKLFLLQSTTGSPFLPLPQTVGLIDSGSSVEMPFYVVQSLASPCLHPHAFWAIGTTCIHLPWPSLVLPFQGWWCAHYAGKRVKFQLFCIIIRDLHANNTDSHTPLAYLEN